MSPWISKPTVIAGLGDVGNYSGPEVFLDGATLKLIVGEYANWFGFYWNGSTWISDASIVNGLVPINHPTNSSPTIFLDGSTWKLICGVDTGTISGYCQGYYWNGSAWISDSSIVAGIGNVGWYPSPGVFLDGSTRKLLVFCGYLNYYGFYWNGSTWISDSSIVAGLSAAVYPKSPSVFLDGSTLKLIHGDGYGTFHGFYWNGSSWISDSSIISGLGDVGYISVPSVFLDGLTRKLISGDRYGTFDGFEWIGIVTISGNVKDPDGNNFENVTISFDGTVDYSTITDANGNYSQLVNPDIYTVTASFVGYLPNSIIVDASAASQVQNFVLNKPVISGNVKDSSGNNINGVNIVSVDGELYNTVTDLSGDYTQEVYPDIYTVTASLPGYLPVSGNVDVTISDQIQNFVLGSDAAPHDKGSLLESRILLESNVENLGER